MDDMGQMQPICCVMALVGAVGLLICGKEFYFGDGEIY